MTEKPQLAWDSVLVSLWETPAEILFALERASIPKKRGAAPSSEWLSLSELRQLTGETDARIKAIINFLANYSKSLDIEEEEHNGEPHYKAIFRVLDGAHVIYASVYNEKDIVEVERVVEVEKIVEKEVQVIVHQPQPIVVGSVFDKQLQKGKRRPQNATDPKKKSDIVVWPEDIGYPHTTPDFVTPSYYEEMAYYVSMGQHIALVGPPGVGKSTAIRQLAHDYRKTLIRVPADSGLHRRDVGGLPQVTDGKTYLLASSHAAAATFGWWSQIDEINTTTSDAAIPILMAQISEPFVTDLGGTNFPVHPDFRLFISYNRGLIGTKALNQAFEDRFHIIEVKHPEGDELKSLLYSHGLADTNLAQVICNFLKEVWGLKDLTAFQLSLRRIYDAIILMHHPSKKFSVQHAMRSAILPYVRQVNDSQKLGPIIDRHFQFVQIKVWPTPTVKEEKKEEPINVEQ